MQSSKVRADAVARLRQQMLSVRGAETVTEALLLAVQLARALTASSPGRLAELDSELEALPECLATTVAHSAQLELLARKIACAGGARFVANGMHLPLAAEAARRLGAVAPGLVTCEGLEAASSAPLPVPCAVPFVVVAPAGDDHQAGVELIVRLKANGNYVIAIASRGERDLGALVDDIVLLPWAGAVSQPFTTLVAMRILVHHSRHHLAREKARACADFIPGPALVSMPALATGSHRGEP